MLHVTPARAGGERPTKGLPLQPMPRLMDAVETATALRISTRTVWALAKGGELPVVCIGRRRLFDPADVAAFIASRKHGPELKTLDSSPAGM